MAIVVNSIGSTLSAQVPELPKDVDQTESNLPSCGYIANRWIPSCSTVAGGTLQPALEFQWDEKSSLLPVEGNGLLDPVHEKTPCERFDGLVPDLPYFYLYRWGLLFTLAFSVTGSFYAFDLPGQLNRDLGVLFQFTPEAWQASFSQLYAIYALPNAIMPFLIGKAVEAYGTTIFFFLLVFDVVELHSIRS
jgi:hypothetical protein